MIEFELREIIPHSSPSGALAAYQSRLASQFFVILFRLESASRAISSDANAAISARMQSFFAARDERAQRREMILSAMHDSGADYDAMQSEIHSINEFLLSSVISLRTESLDIHDAAFEKMKPECESAFKEFEGWRAGLPENCAHRFEFELQRMNQQYLETKKSLLGNFYQLELETRSSGDDAVRRFLDGTDAWKERRFQDIVDDAKVKLDYKTPIDYGAIFEDFSRDQGNFTKCVDTSIQNATLILPPDHFAQSDLDKWWNEVLELIGLHSHFINHFLSRIRKKINEKGGANDDLIQKVREQLLELRAQQVVDSQIAWLLPLQHLCDGYFQKFYDKLSRYWQNRNSAFLTSFSAIREFLQKMILLYRSIPVAFEEDERRLQTDLQRLDAETQTHVSGDEQKLQQKIEEINLFATEKDITAGVTACKEFIQKVADEYRVFYERAIDRLDQKKPPLLQLIPEKERELLAALVMRRVDPRGSGKRPKLPTAPAPKSARRRPVRYSGKVGVFSCTLPDDSRFEEVGPLRIMPTINDFVDEESVSVARRGRPAAKFKKPPSRRKGKSEEPEELDVPELVLFENVPVTAVVVPVPQPDALDEHVNQLRQAVMQAFYAQKLEFIEKIERRRQREELVDQFNARMRSCGARVAEIELNVGETRKLQLESRQSFIEKYFRQMTTAFNKELAGVEQKVHSKKKSLMKECRKLQVFVDKLSEQQTATSFSELSQDYRSEEQRVTDLFQRESDELTSQIKTFQNSFQSSTERFHSVIATQEPPLSKDEKDLCNKTLEKLTSRVARSVRDVTRKISKADSEATVLKESISEEFERILPHHRMDVQFLGTLCQCQSEARSKYIALQFRNGQSEDEIRMAIDTVRSAQLIQSGPQRKIEKLFEVVDLLRIAIIRRAKFLGILNTDLSADPITVQIELSVHEPQIIVEPVAERRKQSFRQSTANMVKLAVPCVDIPITLRDQIDLVGSEMIAQVTKHARNYYRNVRTRKCDITRPDIQPNQKDCIKAMSDQWGKIIADGDEIICQSSEKLREQVLEAIAASRGSVKVIFDSARAFYENATQKASGEVRTIFAREKLRYQDRRDAIRRKLSLRLADPNQTQFLSSVLEEEHIRSAEEEKMIASYNATMIEAESVGMRNFIRKLCDLVKSALSLFDTFVMEEDLASGYVENAERRTLAVLLKEKARRENEAQISELDRPFRHRAWPQLNVVMSCMEQFGTSSSHPEAQSRKARRATPRLKRQNEAPSEKTTQCNSLDTALHRGVMVERNDCYDSYEKALSERMAMFQAEMEQLIGDWKAQAESWRLSILSLKPDYVFSPI
jgi:hypothetical protein